MPQKLGMSEEEINNKIDEQIAEIREELEQQMGIETEEDFYSFLAHNGISDSEVFRKMLKQQIVVQEYAIKDIEVSEEEVEAEYNSLFGNVQEVQASHILVDDLETAELIKEKLDAGADFAELAIEYSKDPGSGQKGGELGFFPRGQMVPAFEEVAFSLSVGEISDPVESQFGYHIIFVTDQVVYDKTFEEAEEEIRTNLQLNQAEQFHVVLNEMKEEVKIKIKDQQFKDLFEN
ncbi:MAG: peptidylprolyl isomerase [Bacillaceae bacterium]|nr:peptidylprolyl isomerase [Bacillaceae bacterium]